MGDSRDYGNRFEISFDDEFRDLHERLAALRELSPIVPVHYLGEDGWMLLDREGVRDALRDEVTMPLGAYFKDVIDPAVGRTIMSMEGAAHA